MSELVFHDSKILNSQRTGSLAVSRSNRSHAAPLGGGVAASRARAQSAIAEARADESSRGRKLARTKARADESGEARLGRRGEGDAAHEGQLVLHTVGESVTV